MKSNTKFNYNTEVTIIVNATIATSIKKSLTEQYKKKMILKKKKS